MITEPGEKHTSSPNKWEKINGKNPGVYIFQNTMVGGGGKWLAGEKT